MWFRESQSPKILGIPARDDSIIEEDTPVPGPGGAYTILKSGGTSNHRPLLNLAGGGSAAIARKNIQVGFDLGSDDLGDEKTIFPHASSPKMRSISPSSKPLGVRPTSNGPSYHSPAMVSSNRNDYQSSHLNHVPRQELRFPTQLSQTGLHSGYRAGSYIETGSDNENRQRKPTLAEVLETVTLNSKRTTALPHSAKYRSVERLSNQMVQPNEKLNDSSEAPDTNREHLSTGSRGPVWFGAANDEANQSFASNVSFSQFSGRSPSVLSGLLADYASSASIHHPQVKQLETLREENSRLHLDNAILANRVNSLKGSLISNVDLMGQYQTSLQSIKQSIQDLKYRMYEIDNKTRELNNSHQQQLGLNLILTERRMRLLEKLHYSRTVMWEMPSGQDNPLNSHQRLQRVRSNPLLPQQPLTLAVGPSPSGRNTEATDIRELSLMKLSSILCGDEELPTLLYVQRLEAALAQHSGLRL